MGRKKRKYVYGNDKDIAYLYGADEELTDAISATTLKNATRLQKAWASTTVYELVPVDDEGRRLN